MDAALSLDRHRPLGRFGAPVEAEYRLWLADHVLPITVALGATSAVAWIAALVTAYAAKPDSLDLGVVYAVTAANALMIVIILGAFFVAPRLGRLAVGAATVAIALTALDSFLAIGPAMDATPMVYLAGGIFYGLLAPATQLPFRSSVALATLIFAIALWRTATHADSHWDANQVIVLVTMGVAVLVMGPATSWTTERGLRSAFASERVIDRQRALIRRYAPSAVVSRIELGDSTVDSPQRRKVTVFFSDVVGFTSMADRIDPEALAEIVNDYLGNLADLIERHGGTLNEFAGDGVMAIFGAPDEMDPVAQVRAAVAAARELQHSLPEWSKHWYQHGIVEDAQARIGINTGTVSVGTFGSTVRATYTGIGLQTNIAARVQAQAEPGGILLSNTSWHLVKDEIPCEPRGQVMVKGVHFPIELYAVVVAP